MTIRKRVLTVSLPPTTPPERGEGMVKALGLALAVVLALGGCPLLSGGGGEAFIVSFDIDGIVGSAVIDTDQRTVVATVEPTDISTIEPAVAVSEGATLTTSPLVDGAPATFTVRAADGTEVAWNVTVNVQYGVSFTYGTTKVVMTRGVVDGTNAYSADYLGNGTPIGYSSGTNQHVLVAGAEYLDVSTWSGPYVQLSFWGQDTGAFDSNSSRLFYSYDGTGYYYDVVAGWSLQISTYGPVGGTIQGTFSAASYPGEEPQGALSGFFKARRIADNASWGN